MCVCVRACVRVCVLLSCFPGGQRNTFSIEEFLSRHKRQLFEINQPKRYADTIFSSLLQMNITDLAWGSQTFLAFVRTKVVF